jgi:hypothetical protein
MINSITTLRRMNWVDFHTLYLHANIKKNYDFIK